jgi:Protein of unknown function (DUF3011)/Ricin-type beta-trefoil lectin domain
MNMIGSRKLRDSARRAAPSVAVMAAAVALAICLPQTASAQGGFDGPGRYEITNSKSGKVLDVDRNDQTSVIQFSSRETDNQIWDISTAGSGHYYLRNTMNGNALEGSGNKNPVRAARFHGNSSQQWRFSRGKDGDALIVSRGGKALDIPGGTSSDGARVQLYDVSGDSNQRFTFRRVSGNWAGGSGGNASTITCSSDDGRRVHCATDTRGGVRLVRRMSDASCQEGSSWGYDSRSIWVDRGCRAEFEASGGGWGGNSGAITCSSDNGRRVYCSADTRGGVRLVRQISGSRCDQGRTWGYDERGIWVDRGCRGEFDVLGRRGSGGRSRTIGAGTTVSVRTNERINVNKSDGRVFTAVVDQDVMDTSGNVAVSRGSNAELIVRRASDDELALDLESVTVNGQRYAVAADDAGLGSGQQDGIGANKRTGEFIGGGALVGAIIGAIAGGGRGAAIGAGAGAAAGAGTQVLTRGNNVNVPSESRLTFRLEQPLEMGVARYRNR